EGGRATGLAQAWSRPGFGDIHTLRSNNGFDDEYACVSPRLSHAEKEAKAHLTAVASPRKRMPSDGEAGCAGTLPSLQSAMSERDGGLARGL
ncbi:MAG TPA: hypothetical protein VFL86_09310, partial [Burkholderiaceae bacterium]|nr:hypothetical protein [Burkholderiaceae bacterium]